MEEDSEDIRAAMCQKRLCELDSLRQYACQEKINGIVVRVQQCSRNVMKEKENVWLKNQEKYLKKEEEIFHKLHEEEEESRKRQEQLVYEHEQHAKRFNEINKIIMRVEERERENEERNRQLHLQQRMLTEKCHTYVMEYRTIYEKFVECLKSCKDKKALGEKSASSVTKLKSLSEIMSVVLEKCKNIAVIEDDLQTCIKVLEDARNIVEKVQADVELVNKEYCQVIVNAKHTEETTAAPAPPSSAISTVPVESSEIPQNSDAKQIQSIQQAAIQVSNEGDLSSALKEYVNESAYQKYNALNQFRETFAKSFESLLRDKGMKKFRFECQKAVNTPVNAISPLNASHLQDKLAKLQRLLTGQTVETGSSHFSAAQHPQGVAFCKDLLAKKFVNQGETTVSSKPEAAFAIAAVIVSLWIEFPDFGQLLLAHFYKECPYIVPFFKPRLVDQTDMEYYRSLGYHYSETGEVEKQDKFLKRMSGIMHLYCAIIVTPPKRHTNKPHPMGIGEAWRWIASVINLDPRPDICATLLYEFLEVGGHFMYNYYGKVFQKILHLMCTEYYNKLEEVTPSAARGPVARLKSFLQKILKQGRINPPTGLLPIGFW